MKNKGSKRPTRESTKVIKRVVPAIASDTFSYFTREEAKISAKGISTGTMLLLAIGILTEPSQSQDTVDIHSNINIHSNQAMVNGHTNTGAINMHLNSSSHANLAPLDTHSNVNTHSSTVAVNQHANINAHTNQAAASAHSNAGHTNVAANHANQSAT